MQPGLIHSSKLHLPRGQSRSRRSSGQHWRYLGVERRLAYQCWTESTNQVGSGWFRCTRLTCWWTRMQSCGLISGRAKFHERGRPLTKLPYRLSKGHSGPRSFLARLVLSFDAEAFEFNQQCKDLINLTLISHAIIMYLLVMTLITYFTVKWGTMLRDNY